MASRGIDQLPNQIPFYVFGNKIDALNLLVCKYGEKRNYGAYAYAPKKSSQESQNHHNRKL